MGYWDQNEKGESFSGDGSMVWGDAPADTMDNAIEEIVDAFEKNVGRPPTVGELKAGLLFSLGEFRYKPDDTPYDFAEIESSLG